MLEDMPATLRVLVCGGRDNACAPSIYSSLTAIHKERPIGVLIEGDARGTDRIAGYWARRNKIDNLKFPADWNAHGRSAGPIRNQKMISEGRPDLVVAFPGGRGTADMVARARSARIKVLEIVDA